LNFPIRRNGRESSPTTGDQFRLVETEDGSPTFHSNDFEEACHARQGALRESRLKFVAPALDHLALRPCAAPLRILDACFGLGYNTFSFLAEAAPLDRTVEVLGIEKERGILSQLGVMARVFPIWADVFESLKEGNEARIGDHRVRVESRGLETLYRETKDPHWARPEGAFDLIFHDAFSPRKCPALWCVELFRRYAGLLRDGGAVITYSSAHPVCAGFIEAGFSVRNTPAVDRRQGGLIAVKDGLGIIDPRLKALHEESTAGVPYRALQGEAGGFAPSLSTGAILERWEREKAERIASGKLSIKRWLRRAAKEEAGPSPDLPKW
jgi:hypothetical protein